MMGGVGGGGGVRSMMNEGIFNQKVSLLLFIPAYATIMELSIMVIGNQGLTHWSHYSLEEKLTAITVDMKCVLGLDSNLYKCVIIRLTVVPGPGY